jgi:hypothetical protein
MKRSEIPLEEFEIRFNGEGLKDAKKSKESLVTALRFMDKDILPKISEFSATLPGLIDIENRALRTPEDGRYLLAVEALIREFVRGQEDRIFNYINKAGGSHMDESDVRYITMLILHKLRNETKSMKAVSDAISEKFDRMLECARGHLCLDYERNEMEDSVAEAGERYRTRVDKLIRG